MPTEPLLLIAALVAVLIFGRLVLNLITRFLPLIVVAVLAAILLSQCDSVPIP